MSQSDFLFYAYEELIEVSKAWGKGTERRYGFVDMLDDIVAVFGREGGYEVSCDR